MAVTVNTFVDMEAGNDADTLTTTILDACTHEAANGSWSISASPLTGFTVSADDLGTLNSPVTVSGITYTGAGGVHGWDYHHTANPDKNVNYAPVTPGTKMALGCFFKTTLAAGVFGSYDMFQIIGTNGTTAVFQVQDGATVFAIAHGSSPIAGTTSSVGNVTMTTGTTYWINLLYDGVNSLCKVALFNPTTWAQVGSTLECAIDPGVTIQTVRIGCNGHGSRPDKHSYFDNLIMDWTTATFPLGFDTATFDAIFSMGSGRRKKALIQGSNLIWT